MSNGSVDEGIEVIDREKIEFPLPATERLFVFFEKITKNRNKGLKIRLDKLGLSYGGFRFVALKWNKKMKAENRQNDQLKFRIVGSRGGKPVIYVWVENSSKVKKKSSSNFSVKSTLK